MQVINNTAQAAKTLSAALGANCAAIPVFDVDGVLVSAAHRISFKDGVFDLDHYRANTTAEQVAKDKSLPLLQVIHDLNKQGKPYHVATARVACKHTRKLFESRGIKPQVIMSRDGDNDHRRDSELKATKLMANFTPQQLANMVLIDDVKGNCEAAIGLGMKAVHVNETEGGHMIQANK